MEDYILQKKTDRGLVREKNEDSVFTSIHPLDEDVKMLAVADGMGGKSFGEKASSFVIEKLAYYFYNSSLEFLNDRELVTNGFRDYIMKLNDSLIKKYGENTLGTTLTLCIINNNETIIFNVGDSRCYITKNNKLIQVTEDDSAVWLFYKNGQIRKDDLRYFSTSNLINSCIGLNYLLCNMSIQYINNDYSSIFLVTDGVSDILTDDRIEEIIKTTEKHDFVNTIINEAVNVDQGLFVPLTLRRRYLEPFIVPKHGKDNASCCAFIKN